MTFEGNTFTGSAKPTLRENFFQIVSDTNQVSSTFNDCEVKEDWNAWICQNDYLGELTIIADDGDWEDRSVVPVYVTSSDGSSNKLNAAMDHMWDGFYAG